MKLELIFLIIVLCISSVCFSAQEKAEKAFRTMGFSINEKNKLKTSKGKYKKVFTKYELYGSDGKKSCAVKENEKGEIYYFYISNSRVKNFNRNRDNFSNVKLNKAKYKKRAEKIIEQFSKCKPSDLKFVKCFLLDDGIVYVVYYRMINGISVRDERVTVEIDFCTNRLVRYYNQTSNEVLEKEPKIIISQKQSHNIIEEWITLADTDIIRHKDIKYNGYYIVRTNCKRSPVTNKLNLLNEEDRGLRAVHSFEVSLLRKKSDKEFVFFVGVDSENSEIVFFERKDRFK